MDFFIFLLLVVVTLQLGCLYDVLDKTRKILGELHADLTRWHDNGRES